MLQLPHRFAAIGECMIELTERELNTYVKKFAGDTLNTAVYLLRHSDPKQVSVDYITAVGEDRYSTDMLAYWKQEKINVDHVRRIPGKLPGLYLIHNDQSGEREFYYYRSESAARDMFIGSVGDFLCQQLLTFNTIYLSGITLAILPEASREKLIRALREAKKAGISIAVDINYRPRLWPNVKGAKSAIQQLLACASIALPSLEDVHQLFFDKTPEETAKRLHELGVGEVVVKQGRQGYFVATMNRQSCVPIKPVENPVDTTGAGDSFNGAYLAARIAGLDPIQAAKKGAEVAAVVIMHPGAITPR